MAEACFSNRHSHTIAINLNGELSNRLLAPAGAGDESSVAYPVDSHLGKATLALDMTNRLMVIAEDAPDLNYYELYLSVELEGQDLNFSLFRDEVRGEAADGSSGGILISKVSV